MFERGHPFRTERPGLWQGVLFTWAAISNGQGFLAPSSNLFVLQRSSITQDQDKESGGQTISALHFQKSVEAISAKCSPPCGSLRPYPMGLEGGR